MPGPTELIIIALIIPHRPFFVVIWKVCRCERDPRTPLEALEFYVT